MRPSATFCYRLWTSYFGIFAFSAIAAEEEPPPSLRPPRGELLPGFWEQHGWQVAIAALVALVLVTLFVRWLRHTEPPLAKSPAGVARSRLEALRGRSEDGAVVAEATQILRTYIISAFDLPPGELTTAELNHALSARPQTNRELVAAINAFLHRCDERKFAPVPPVSSLSLVDQALELVGLTEKHQMPVPVVAGSEPGTSNPKPSTA